ncbi:hypothetical protein Peur_033055 [Populus x canadensis]
MDARMQIALPLPGTVAADAAAAAASAVNFSELREKSLRDLDEHEDGRFESSLSSRKIKGEQEERLKKKTRIDHTRKRIKQTKAAPGRFEWDKLAPVFPLFKSL